MRTLGLSSLLGVACLFGCNSSTPSSKKTISYFEGSVDVQKGTMDVTFGKGGEASQALTLPYGTGANQVYFHTVSVAWNGGAHQLSGNVTAVNGYATAVNNLTAVIDSIAGTGVTSNGPFNYNTVAGNSASGAATWVFSDPGDTNFTFSGHAEGDVGPATPCGQNTHKCAFVTSTIQNANMGGVSGGDSICNALAGTAGLGGTFKAWLSNSTQSPSTTFAQASVPYRQLDGIPIASNWADLVDGTLSNPFWSDEYGNSTLEFVAWTGTTDQGTSFPLNCNGFMDGTGGGNGAIGSFGSTSGWSLSGSINNCSNSFPIYCFEQ